MCFNHVMGTIRVKRLCNDIHEACNDIHEVYSVTIHNTLNDTL